MNKYIVNYVILILYLFLFNCVPFHSSPQESNKYDGNTEQVEFQSDLPDHNSVEISSSLQCSWEAGEDFKKTNYVEDIGDCLSIKPTEISFGSMPVSNCIAKKRFAIYNRCNYPIHIKNISIPNSSTSFHYPGLRNLTLQSNTTFCTHIFYTNNTTTTTSNAELVIESTDPQKSSIKLIMKAQLQQDLKESTEFFKQIARPQIDIILVIDNSLSLKQHLPALYTYFEGFYNSLLRSYYDFQIGIIFTSNQSLQTGEFQQIVYYLDDPNSAQTKMKVLFSGINVHAGLETMRQSLQLAKKNIGKNQNFLRKDAELSVVFISTHEDTSGSSVTEYANFLQSVKNHKQQISVSAIIVSDTQCITSNQSLGHRYMQLVQQFNGRTLSFCQPMLDSTLWNSRYENSPNPIIPGLLLRFYLQMPALKSSIQVFINDQLVPPTLWKYIENEGAIIFFRSNPPTYLDNIMIRYIPICTE